MRYSACMRTTASLPPGCILADIIAPSMISGEAVEELATCAAGSLLNSLVGPFKSKMLTG